MTMISSSFVVHVLTIFVEHHNIGCEESQLNYHEKEKKSYLYLRHSIGVYIICNITSI
jgi:hypothetical protein